MTVDAVSDQGSCHEAQSPPDSPSVCTHRPFTASSVEVARTSFHDSEGFASTGGDDSIPRTRTTAPMPPKLHQEQDLDDASCGSSDAESLASECQQIGVQPQQGQKTAEGFISGCKIIW
ncbi:hypothetical protein DL769_005528 [Monosporascus sp. CRB-8-3]|nr:hypothetical protein DL769_005528 [Monosporascus sp. CRB-8-3]